MKDIDVIGNILQTTAAIESELGRFIVQGVATTAPCIVFGNIPKDQTNYPQILITNASGDGDGRLVKFSEYNVNVITKEGDAVSYNGTLKGQEIAREVVKAFDYKNQTDTMTYASRVPQFYNNELVYSPVIVRVVHKE